jgi:hypothetical protein
MNILSERSMISLLIKTNVIKLDECKILSYLYFCSSAETLA